MARYVFDKIEIENFKYVMHKRPITIELRECDIVILGGQNGYGKTTLFDAIELLLSGRIKHFNPDLLNRGAETVAVLANDYKHDIVIKAWLRGKDNTVVVLKRIFECEKNYLDKIIWNDEEVSQDELYRRLKTNQNMLNIGTYISQSQSLDFLQNKYKSRKEQVSTLLENPEEKQKLQLLKDTFQKLSEIVENKTRVLREETVKAEKEVVQLEEHVKSIAIMENIKTENIKLFPNREFKFDEDQFDLKIPYLTVIKPLEQIQAFIKNYGDYKKIIRNKCVEQTLAIPEQVYLKLFYLQNVLELENKQELINFLEKSKKILGQLKEHIWVVEEDVFLKIGVETNIIQEIKESMEFLKNVKANLNGSEKTLADINKARKVLIGKFEESVKQGVMNDGVCPLCGSSVQDLKIAFETSEKALANIFQNSSKIASELENKISMIFEQKVVPMLEVILKKNSELLIANDILGACKNLKIDELESKLLQLQITEFKPFNMQVLDLVEFNNALEKVRNQIQQCRQAMTVVITEEQLEMYKTVHKVYYENGEPLHTAEEIECKKRYIASCYLGEMTRCLGDAKKKKEDAESVLKAYEAKSGEMLNHMNLLVRKYEETNKEYQTSLANAIKLPLVIYSGKIIQNYPLGLGIKAIVRTNQLVFEATAKSGVDVYNILSTGQLNGLAIAILLAVRNVYGNPDGLDIIMIDDPLQTIDDISAISLADLLAQQDIGQIILSTHEDQKAKMLRFKFEEKGLSVIERNMQEIYLENKTM